MNKPLTISWACLLTMAFFLSTFSTLSFGQQKFEGYWEQQTNRTSNLPMQPPKVTESEKVFYKQGKMKNMNLTAGKAIIIRLDKELLWEIDHKNKTYTEVTFAQMQDVMKSARSAMKEEMKDMSREERKMMEKMMGKKLGPMFGDENELEISVKQAGKHKTILGYDCEQFFLNLNDQPLMELWVSNKYTLGNNFMELYQKMGLLKGKLSDEAKKIQGVPLATRVTIDTGMGKIESESQVTKLVPTSVSDDEFEIPQGYKKQNLRPPFEE